MAKVLFRRIAELIVQPVGDANSFVISDGLRFTFESKKSTSTDPNQSKIVIYNLSESTRNAISKVDALVILKAGYEEGDGLETVCSGTVIKAETTFPKPEVVTTLEIADGGVELRDTRVSLSYRGNTKLQTVVGDLVKAIGKPFRGNLQDAGIPNVKFNTGLTFTGNARTLIEQLGNEHGFSFSIQDGESVIGVKGSSQSTGGALVISPKSGMVGTPEPIKNSTDKKTDKKGENEGTSGWTVKMKLMPTILPNDIVEIQSKAIVGNTFFRAVEVSHSGDTFGDSWESTIQVEGV